MRRISVATWNANGLLAKDSRVARRKAGYFKKLAHSHDILFLQEMHGDVDRVKRLVDDLRTTHFAEYSLMDQKGAGGIAILAKTSILEGAICPPSAKFSHKVG
jgi:exonuclease III